MNNLIKYLVSLCVLLTCGYGLMSAQAVPGSELSRAHADGIEVADNHSLNDQVFIVNPTSDHGGHGRVLLEETENDTEEEISSSKKKIESSDYHTALFCSRILDLFLNRDTGGSSDFEPVSLFSSFGSLNIAFGVFRI